MKVKLLTSMAGIDFSHNAGDTIDCNDEEAKRFIEGGIAEPIVTPKTERSVKKTATKKAVKDR